MDLAKQLIRSVARAFYETKQILVVDALLIHSAYVPLCHLLARLPQSSNAAAER
jgi:transcription initiation factor TFIIE subunit alpha